MYNVRERQAAPLKAGEALSLIRVRKKKGWCTVENTQVTFTVQASGLRGPVGRPILLVCEALDRHPQQLVWFRSSPANTFETNRQIVPEGPLQAANVDLVQTVTERELYTALLFWKGIQAELEAPG